MASFLDYYTRLKLSSGSEAKVVYYKNGVEQQVVGILYKTLGSESVMVKIQDDQIIRIPFLNNTCAIKSIELISYFNELYDGNYLFNNPYVFSHISYDIEKIRINVFGDDIYYESDETSMIESGVPRNKNIVSYSKIFSTTMQREEVFASLKRIIQHWIIYCKKIGISPNLDFCGVGTTSIVYSIGDKVIKFGTPRRYAILPYCEYYLQPIMNKDFFGCGENSIHIEVSKKLKPLSNVEASEVVRFFRRRFPEIGLGSFDLSNPNVGLLESVEENVNNYDYKPPNVASTTVSSIAYNGMLRPTFNSNLFGGRFPVIWDLDQVHVNDIDKYCAYLREVGFTEKKIILVRQDYVNGLFNPILPSGQVFHPGK